MMWLCKQEGQDVPSPLVAVRRVGDPLYGERTPGVDGGARQLRAQQLGGLGELAVGRGPDGPLIRVGQQVRERVVAQAGGPPLVFAGRNWPGTKSTQFGGFHLPNYYCDVN